MLTFNWLGSMFTRIPGTDTILNVREDSGKCSKRFKVMFQKISGNAAKDSG